MTWQDEGAARQGTSHRTARRHLGDCSRDGEWGFNITILLTAVIYLAGFASEAEWRQADTSVSSICGLQSASLA